MKKLISAAAVCTVAVGLVAVPGALAVKSPKQVGGTVSIAVAPNPLSNATTTVTANGNVASNSSCRKDRTLHFYWVTNGIQGPEVASTATRSNGDYTASVPRPTDTAPTADTNVLRVNVDQVTRKVGGKKKGKRTKKGRRFDCLALTADSPPVTLIP